MTKILFLILFLYIVNYAHMEEMDTNSGETISRRNLRRQELTNIEKNKNYEELKEIKKQIKDVQETMNKFIDKLDTSNQHLKNLNHLIKTLVKNQSEKNIPKHCKEIQLKGQNDSGIYTIQPEFSTDPFLVWCDMQTKDGGWTYFLNRFNGDEEFDLSWNEYKTGFGNLDEEFWLGLEKLHQITGYEANELLIELEDWDSNKVYAHYDSFSIGDEDEGYVLKLLGRFSGNAGDSFSYHAGMKFTTKDKDQDRYKAGNCATYRGGGWWYKNCVNSHLTGKYHKADITKNNEYNVMYWEKFHGPKYSLKEARMMVRPKSKKNVYSSEENEN